LKKNSNFQIPNPKVYETWNLVLVFGDFNLCETCFSEAERKDKYYYLKLYCLAAKKMKLIVLLAI